MTWLHSKGKAWNFDMSFRVLVADNIKSIVDRAESMACKQERERVCHSAVLWCMSLTIIVQITANPQFTNNPNAMPVFQTVINLISDATNPMQLIKMGELFVPWF